MLAFGQIWKTEDTNFKHYCALNMVLWLLHGYTKTSNIFYKINYDGQGFKIFP